VLAGALLSITLNPLTFAGIAPLLGWLERRPAFYAFLESRFRRANGAGAAPAGMRRASRSHPRPGAAIMRSRRLAFHPVPRRRTCKITGPSALPPPAP